ncbi:kinase-like domain-containing protein [Pyronema omphalodes]|nr:kinase-like domain-containing protein [Pyronema omphalodes]
MGSPRGSFEEEGEIFESDVEKAPPSLPSVSGPSVDRRSSKLHSTSISPARSTPPHHNDRYSDRDRRNDDYLPRGEKRRRSREGDDVRSHRIHYEAGDRDIALRRARVSYADIDRSEAREAHHDDSPSERYFREAKRSRTQSRSPPSRVLDTDRGRRGGGGRGYYDERRRDGPDSYYDRDRRYGRNDTSRRRSNERAGPERGDNPAPSDRTRRDAEARRQDSDRHADRDVKSSNSEDRTSDNIAKDAKKSDEPVVEIVEPVDEDLLIEERRKKREALKAKYRGGTPLLATALGLRDTQLVSPMGSPADSADITFSPCTPQSPRDLSAGESFTITKEGAAPDHEDGDEPSAADYDPTQDMQDDQKRIERRLHNHEVSSGAYNEMKSVDRDVLMREADVPDTAAHTNGQSKDDNDDFDMFAEGEDDDDMFAPPTTKNTDVSKAVPIIEAKQLDASMLDDWDDHEAYYKVIPGELLDNRYKVTMVLGKGMFAIVVRAQDTITGKDFAIKVIRNLEPMRKAGMKEIDILKKLSAADPEDKKHIVRFERHFDHKGHLCIVFENLNINLRDVLKKSGIRDVGISLSAVRAYAHQMFLGASLLRKCNIIHADIKPDNVLVNNTQNILKICDLGSASDASENEITQYLVSRFYRAPEIILGMPYDFAIDMWSIGCTLYELYTGKILFTGRTNNQMLRSIMECRGKFSTKFLKKGQFTQWHFDSMGGFKSLEKDKVTGKDIVRTLNFTKPTRELKQRLISAATSEKEMKELNLFVNLLENCLNLNPEKRCTPEEALKHPFIRRPVAPPGK